MNPVLRELQRQLNDIAKQLAALQRQETVLSNPVTYSGTPTANSMAYWTGAGTVAHASFGTADVVRTSGSQTIAGAKTFSSVGDFDAGLNVSGGTFEFDPGSGADATRAFNFNILGNNYGKILIPSGSGGAMAFWTGSAGAAAERFRINPSGEINAVPTANIKPVYVIIANNGTENLSTWTTSTNTVLLVHDATAARAALFMVRSTVNEVVELAGDTSGRFTTTFDNASTINVTYSSGYKIQNKTGSSVTIGVLAVHS